MSHEEIRDIGEQDFVRLDDCHVAQPEEKVGVKSSETEKRGGVTGGLRGRKLSFGRVFGENSVAVVRIGLIGVVLIFGVIGVSLVSVSGAKDRGDSGGGNGMMDVKVMRLAGETGYETMRFYTGRVEARRVSELGFERVGRVLKVLVEEGDWVKEGVELAKLDTRELEAERAGLMERKKAEQAKLDEMVAGARQEDVARAHHRVAELTATWERLKKRAARMERLSKGSAAGMDEIDEAKFGAISAKAAMEGAKQEYEKLKNGTRAEQVRGQRAVVEGVGAEIARVDAQLRNSVIVSPFAGRIDRREVDEGVIVSGGKGVLRIVESDVMEFWVGMGVQEARGLKKGDGVNVVIGGREVGAKVKGVMPSVDTRTRTMRVVMSLDNSGDVVSGMVGRLKMGRVVEERGYWAPLGALVKGKRGLWSVYVVKEGVVRRADVEVLHTDGKRVYIRGAVSEGDEIVKEGVDRVVVGQHVTRGGV